MVLSFVSAERFAVERLGKKKWCLLISFDLIGINAVGLANGMLLIDVVVFWRERNWNDELGECCWQFKYRSWAWLDVRAAKRVSVDSSSNWCALIHGKHR